MKDSENKINFVFISKLLASIADQLLLFLIPLVIYKITGSAAMSGLSFAIEWLPRVIAFPLSGFLTDKVGAGRLYISTDFFRGLIIFFFLILLLLVRNEYAFWILTLMGSFVGFFSSQAQIALEYTVKNYFSIEEAPKVQAKIQICEQLSLILAPLFAGLALKYIQYPVLIAITGFLFIFSGFVSKKIFNDDFSRDKNSNPETKIVQSFIRGCRHIWESKYLKLLVLFSIFANFFYGVILALNAPIIKGIFLASDQALSMMYTIAGSVTIATLSFIPLLTRYLAVKIIGVIGILLFLISAIFLSLASNYKMYIVFYSFFIAGIMLTNIMTRTYRVKLVPTADFGITVGVIFFIMKSAMPIAGFSVSLFSEKIGLQPFILLSVLGSTVIFLIFAIFMFAKPILKLKWIINSSK